MASALLNQPKQRLKLGPGDCGCPLTEEQFLNADYDSGYHYELIEGRLDVVTLPRQPHDWIEQWLFGLLHDYSEEHPEVLNRVTNKGVVYVPGTIKTTRPEPDIVAYHDFPLERGIRVEWQDISPVLVVEVLSEGGLAKDLVRNVKLYARVPSIREYWVVDALAIPERPTMTVRCRKGKSWQVQVISFGETYATKLLPGFAFKLDPMSE